MTNKRNDARAGVRRHLLVGLYLAGCLVAGILTIALLANR
jgi:hypothetical protein